jgi:hypothetical protein
MWKATHSGCMARLGAKVDKFVLKRQWQRSTLLGFVRRMWRYKFGMMCSNGLVYADYEVPCSGRICCVSRVETAAGVSERWECNRCNYGYREIF